MHSQLATFAALVAAHECRGNYSLEIISMLVSYLRPVQLECLTGVQAASCIQDTYQGYICMPIYG